MSNEYRYPQVVRDVTGDLIAHIAERFMRIFPDYNLNNPLPARQAVDLMCSEIVALRSQRAKMQEQIIQLEQDKREREILATERRRQ